MTSALTDTATPVTVCRTCDLVPGSGVAVKIEDRQFAVIYLPEEHPQIYVIDNHDPLGQANVLSRGIVGDRNGELVIASPLYKQHYNLLTGTCQEDAEVSITCYRAELAQDKVVIWL